MNREFDMKSFLMGRASGGGGSAPSGTLDITANGTYDVGPYASAAVNVPTGGGNPEAAENDVIFIDYDGTIRYSYTAADFLKLSEMPANPTHDRLTAQGWNWELAEAKAYVEKYGELVVGQMYVTADGKTRLYISLNPKSKTVTLIYEALTGTATVDWGDGTSTELDPADYQAPHEYPDYDDYVISIDVDGTIKDIALSYTGAYTIRAIETGRGVLSWYMTNQNYASMSHITMSSAVSFVLFSQSNNGLSGIVIPPGVDTLGINALYSKLGLRYIALPPGCRLGSQSLQTGNSLRRISLQDAPEGSASYTISDSLRQCRSLTRVLIPETVTSIESNAFYGCATLRELHVRPKTPPTLGGSLGSDFSAQCVIYVPKGTLEAYQAASNWSTYASQMREEA